MQYTVDARGIRKSFGTRTVVDGVDLAVRPGEILALLGPNGAGKTTLIRILTTLLRPDAGTATIAGHDLLTDPRGVRRVISLTGQYADQLAGTVAVLHHGRIVAQGTPAELKRDRGALNLDEVFLALTEPPASQITLREAAR